MNMTRFRQMCPRLGEFDPTAWESVSTAFASCPPCSLGQAWHETPEPAFLPAMARFGWRDTCLWLYAEIHDLEIRNAADGSNQPMWELGDVIELFLRPPGDETYYEFHITPENHTLQLCFPHAGALNAVGDWTQFVVDYPVLQSWTLREPERHQWRARCALDQNDIYSDAALASACNALFSVSRYDWPSGQNAPVISSTSPHQKPWFHRQEEWGELVLMD